MKIILDECLPRRMTTEITSHDVTTVPKRGWAGKKNGVLLSLIQGEFDVFITVDRNLTFQQNVEDLKIAILVLHAPTNRFEELKRLIPEINRALTEIKPGQIIHIHA